MQRYIQIDIIRTRKPASFQGTSLKDLERLPENVRERLLLEVERLRDGLDPLHWKPMTTVGPGVREVRIKVGQQYRLLYVASFPEAVYVLHVFEKKTQRTASRDLDLAKARFRVLLHSRREAP